MTALSNLKVIDLTVARAGPAAVRQFADFGADVIRIEEPSGGEGVTGGHETPDYLNLHRNKRAIGIDLKRPAGIEVLHRLVMRADVLVENFRPPVKHRLGIDYATLSALNPRLVYGSISGYGQDGPASALGAVDQIIQGVAGAMSVTGTVESGPIRAGFAVSDMAAGQQLAIGLLTALLERERSGLGQWVHVSLLEAMISFLDFQAARWTVDHEVPGQEGNQHPTITPMGTFATANGLVNVATLGAKSWRTLCDALGHPELATRAEFSSMGLRGRNRAQLFDLLQQIFLTQTSAHWIDVLTAVAIPCGRVNRLDETFADPQVVHLGMESSVVHETRGAVNVVRQPVNLLRTPAVMRTASPLPGRHRDEILQELGYSTAEIAGLVSDGVV